MSLDLPTRGMGKAFPGRIFSKRSEITWSMHAWRNRRRSDGRWMENRGNTLFAGRLGLPFGPDTMYYFVGAFFLNMSEFDACLGA